MFKPKVKVNADGTAVTVTVTLTPANNRAQHVKYGTNDMKSWLLAQGYKVTGSITSAVALNYEGPERLSATWKFSLENKTKPAVVKNISSSSSSVKKNHKSTTGKKQVK
jgi:hypothetical protein